MKPENWTRRAAVYLVGMFSYACGACLATKAALGLTPVTSISYVLTLLSGLSLGTVMMVYNLVLLLLERVLYGDAFQRRQYLQLPLSLLFSVFIDLCMALFRGLEQASLPLRGVLFGMALILMGLGIAGMLSGRFIPLPAEGLVQAIAFRFRLEFGRTKLIHDCVVVALTVLTSLVFLGRLEGVQVGTLISALLLGPISKVWLGLLGPLMTPAGPLSCQLEEE